MDGLTKSLTHWVDYCERRPGLQAEAYTFKVALTEIERLRAVIHEAEFLLTVAVVPDGHDRCAMALSVLRGPSNGQYGASPDKEG